MSLSLAYIAKTKIAAERDIFVNLDSAVGWIVGKNSDRIVD